MAKIIVAGKAVVLTSAIKLEEIKTIEKFQPEALCLYGGEDGKEPIFAMGTGAASFNKNGVSFCEANKDGLATQTIIVDAPAEEIKDFVADKYGVAIAALNELENYLPSVLKDIADRKDEVLKSITFAE